MSDKLICRNEVSLPEKISPEKAAKKWIAGFLRSRSRFPVAILLLLGVCYGAKFRTPEDFEIVQKAVSEGQDLSRDILKDYKNIPVSFRLQAVDLAAAVDSKKSRKSLRGMLTKDDEDTVEVKSRIAGHLIRMQDTDSLQDIKQGIQADKIILDDSAAEFLMNEKSPEIAEILHKGLQAGKITYSVNLINYFADLKYVTAIPSMFEHLDKNSFPDETIKALVMMRGESPSVIEDKIFSIISGRSHPARIFALRSLREDFSKDKIRTAVMSVFKYRMDESDEAVIAALDAAEKLPYDKNLASQIKEIYIYEDRPNLRSRAAAVGAKMYGFSEEQYGEEMKMPLAEYQSRMSFLKAGGDDADDTFLLQAEMPGTIEETLEKKTAETPETTVTADSEKPEKIEDVSDEIKKEEWMDGAKSPSAKAIQDNQNKPMNEPECNCKELQSEIERQKKIISAKKAEKTVAKKQPAAKKSPAPAKKTAKKTAKKSIKKIMPESPAAAKKTEKSEKGKVLHSAKKKKHLRKVPPVSDGKYLDVLNDSMSVYFGTESAKYMRGKITRALVNYSNRNDDESALILRIYERKYRVSETTLRGYMRKGLDHPGALGALVDGFREEFETEELQIYAFSQFFALKRWEAEALFHMSDEKGL